MLCIPRTYACLRGSVASEPLLGSRYHLSKQKRAGTITLLCRASHKVACDGEQTVPRLCIGKDGQHCHIRHCLGCTPEKNATEVTTLLGVASRGAQYVPSSSHNPHAAAQIIANQGLTSFRVYGPSFRVYRPSTANVDTYTPPYVI